MSHSRKRDCPSSRNTNPKPSLPTATRFALESPETSKSGRSRDYTTIRVALAVKFPKARASLSNVVSSEVYPPIVHSSLSPPPSQTFY